MCKAIDRAYLVSIIFLECYALPVLMLFVRFWLARIFFYSGLVKISDWHTTIMLFTQLYKVPGFSPDVAAYITTVIELCCPVLLLFGFASRLAAIPMLILSLVIQFTFQASAEHIYWAMLLGMILCYGPGTLSLDHLIKSKKHSIIGS